MLVFQLYKPALIGSGSIVFGTLLNNFVISQNNGKMPAFPSLSYLTGYIKPHTFQAVNDIHVLGSGATHWKFLTDYIDFGYSILSPGDLFIHFFHLHTAKDSFNFSKCLIFHSSIPCTPP